MSKNNSTKKATLATINYAGFEFPGLKLPNGKYGIAVPQIVNFLEKEIDGFLFSKNTASRDLKRLLGNDCKFIKVSSELTNSKVNTLTLEMFFFLCYKLSVSGKDLTGKGYSIAKHYYTEQKDWQKISILEGLKYLSQLNKKESKISKQRELQIQNKYSVMWNCQKEYIITVPVIIDNKVISRTNIGRADLVNNNLVAEIKQCKQWKHGLGQLLAYNKILERKEMWLILFDCKQEPINLIEKIVSSFGIKVKFIK